MEKEVKVIRSVTFPAGKVTKIVVGGKDCFSIAGAIANLLGVSDVNMRFAADIEVCHVKIAYSDFWKQDFEGWNLIDGNLNDYPIGVVEEEIKKRIRDIRSWIREGERFEEVSFKVEI